MTLDELAFEIIEEFEKGTMFFSWESINNLDDNDLKDLDGILLQKLPNLIITHRDLISDREIRKNILRLREILDNGETPYFIVFSRENESVKRKIKI